MSRTWDVFCRVVDNYGDAAVCWRLALQLAAERAAHVRLWIDSLSVLHALCPAADPDTDRQTVCGVEVRKWTGDAQFGVPAEIVIEAFGGGLPERYVGAMVARDPHPVWIILEYLSAESFVQEHHGLPSPHPSLPIQRHFFFPGFVPGTGGLLREAPLEKRRRAFQRSSDGAGRMWQLTGFSRPCESATVISMFGYENPAAASFLNAWSESPQKVVVAVPASRLRAQVCAFFDSPDPGDGGTLQRGALEVRFMPFLSQPLYDELLWASDWNFVRGEDSFVRAQWARRPMVWHIYPQLEDAHRLKLDAFLELYCAGLDPVLRGPLVCLWQSWNKGAPGDAGQILKAWRTLSRQRDALRLHCNRWADRLEIEGDLAANLAQFCEERLK